MYLCLFVTFRVTSRKRKLRKHGYEYEALGQGSGDQFLLSAILYRLGFVHERPHSSGDKYDRKIAAKTQTLKKDTFKLR